MERFLPRLSGEAKEIDRLQHYMNRPWRSVYDELLARDFQVSIRTGAWKTTLVVAGWDYVLKYPLNPGDVGAENAMEKEAIAYEEMSKKFRKYTARHWWAEATCVAERLITLGDLHYDRYVRLLPRLRVFANAFAKAGFYDLHDYNFGLDVRGRIKILDLGGHRL